MGKIDSVSFIETLMKKDPGIIYVVVNGNILIEIKNIDSGELIRESILIEYFKTGKLDSKRFRHYEFKTFGFSSFLMPYKVLNSLDPKKYIQSLICFKEDISIIKIVGRPGDSSIYRHIAISFTRGYIGIIHYETKALICLYKTPFGNAISLNYSHDGRLLAIGCEDDNCYIVDSERNSLIYCLEAHMNYITSIIFDRTVIEEEDSTQGDLSVTKTSSNSKLLRKSSTSASRQVDIDEMISFLAQNSLENTKSPDIGLSLELLRRTRTSNAFSTKNVLNFNPENRTFVTTYVLYTASLDGYLATWSIEAVFERNYTNHKNYLKMSSMGESTANLDSTIKTVLLGSTKENKQTSLSYERICSAPIYEMYIYDRLLVYLAKRNNTYNDIYLRILFGEMQIQATG